MSTHKLTGYGRPYQRIPFDPSRRGIRLKTFLSGQVALAEEITTALQTVEHLATQTVRHATVSGFLTPAHVVMPINRGLRFGTYPNTYGLDSGTDRPFAVVIDGALLLLGGTITGTSNPFPSTDDRDGFLSITLDPPPATGIRHDLVFLEAWYTEVTNTDDIYPYGNVQYRGEEIENDIVNAIYFSIDLTSDSDGTETLSVASTVGIEGGDEIVIDSDGDSPIVRTVQSVDHSASTITCSDTVPVGYTTAQNAHIDIPQNKDLVLRYRIRTHAGIPSVGALFDGVNAQGAETAPVSDQRFSPLDGDAGLYRAGDGTDSARGALGTTDGYVYAMPLQRIVRRNTAAYHAQNNPNGSVAAIGDVSDRPDGRFNNEIYAGDVEDLRRFVYWNDGVPTEQTAKAMADAVFSSEGYFRIGDYDSLTVDLTSDTDSTGVLNVGAGNTTGILPGDTIVINDDNSIPIVRTVQSVDSSAGTITCTEAVGTGYTTADGAYIYHARTAGHIVTKEDVVANTDNVPTLSDAGERITLSKRLSTTVETNSGMFQYDNSTRLLTLALNELYVGAKVVGTPTIRNGVTTDADYGDTISGLTWNNEGTTVTLSPPPASISVTVTIDIPRASTPPLDKIPVTIHRVTGTYNSATRTALVVKSEEDLTFEKLAEVKGSTLQVDDVAIVIDSARRAILRVAAVVSLSTNANGHATHTEHLFDVLHTSATVSGCLVDDGPASSAVLVLADYHSFAPTVAYDARMPMGIDPLPTTLDATVLWADDMMRLSNLGGGGGTPGQPYITPFEHIALPLGTHWHNLNNKQDLASPLLVANTGFMRLPIVLRDPVEGAMVFSDAARDAHKNIGYRHVREQDTFGHVATPLSEPMATVAYYLALLRLNASTERIGGPCKGELALAIYSQMSAQHSISVDESVDCQGIAVSPTHYFLVYRSYVRAYTRAWVRDTDHDFDLDVSNGAALDITYFEGELYVLDDGGTKRIFRYPIANPSDVANFTLDSSNSAPQSFNTEGDRHYVINAGSPAHVYVYTLSGTRQQGEELNIANAGSNVVGLIRQDTFFTLASPFQLRTHALSGTNIEVLATGITDITPTGMDIEVGSEETLYISTRDRVYCFAGGEEGVMYGEAFADYVRAGMGADSIGQMVTLFRTGIVTKD